jgi:uncharacterized membrane protein
MSTPTYDTKVRPSALWYLLVAALWIASLVVFIVAIKPIIDIFGSGITEVANNQPVTVTADGLTVYTDVDASTTTCAMVGADQSATPLEPFGNNESFDFEPSGGPHVYALANTPEGMAPGDYTLQCDQARGVRLFTGDRFDLGDVGKRFGLGFLASGLLGLIGLIVLIVLLVKRHKSKSRVRQLEASGAYGSYPASYGGYGQPAPPASYPPPSGYPPPGSYPPPNAPSDYPGSDPRTDPPPPPPPEENPPRT